MSENQQNSLKNSSLKEKRKIRKVKKVRKTKIENTSFASEQIVREIGQNPEHVALVNSIYNKVVPSVAEVIKEGVSLSNVVIIIDTTMRAVGKLQMLSGVEKKALCIVVVHKILEVSDLREKDRAALKIVVSVMLDPLIDQIFAIAPKLYGKAKSRCQGLSCLKSND